MAETYCGTADVRAITNLTTSEITNTEISNLIDQATYQLNSDIGVVTNVRLGDVNHTTGNIDGSNVQFTFRPAPLGDMDNDGSVGPTDIEVWRKLSTDTHYTKMTTGTATVASIDDHEIGKASFTTAPTTAYNYAVKYVWFPIPYNHKLLEKACVELTAYLCFLKVNLKSTETYRLGKLYVSKRDRHPGLVSFYDRYQATLGQIRGRTMLRAIDWEMSEKMAVELEDVFSGAGAGV